MIKAPVLVASKEPQFSPPARALKYGGTCLVNLWVRPDGKVDHINMLRALGLNLDENAMAAVLQYTFKPAMQDGNPVLVEVNVEVNFQIF